MTPTPDNPYRAPEIDSAEPAAIRCRPRRAWIAFRIFSAYVVLFFLFLGCSVLHLHVPRGAHDLAGWILFAPIGIWFLPLICVGPGGPNLVQWLIHIACFLLNAAFMAWLLARIASSMHVRFVGK